VKGKSLGEYHTSLLDSMITLFPCGSKNHVGRSSDRNQVIIRLRILELLENLNGGPGKRKRGDPANQPVPFSEPPPRATTVSIATSTVNDDDVVLPSHKSVDGTSHEFVDGTEVICPSMSVFFGGMTASFETTALEQAEAETNASIAEPLIAKDPGLNTTMNVGNRGSFETDLEQRFLGDTVRPARSAEIMAIRPQLVVEDHEAGIRRVMDCTGFEFYINSALRSRRHRFSYKDEEPTLDVASSDLVLITVPPRRNYLREPNFVVLRHIHDIVK
jgi:hypothetical protein